MRSVRSNREAHADCQSAPCTQLLYYHTLQILGKIVLPPSPSPPPIVAPSPMPALTHPLPLPYTLSTRAATSRRFPSIFSCPPSSPSAGCVGAWFRMSALSASHTLLLAPTSAHLRVMRVGPTALSQSEEASFGVSLARGSMLRPPAAQIAPVLGAILPVPRKPVTALAAPRG